MGPSLRDFVRKPLIVPRSLRELVCKIIYAPVHVQKYNVLLFSKPKFSKPHHTQSLREWNNAVLRSDSESRCSKLVEINRKTPNKFYLCLKLHKFTDVDLFEFLLFCGIYLYSAKHPTKPWYLQTFLVVLWYICWNQRPHRAEYWPTLEGQTFALKKKFICTCQHLVGGIILSNHQ